jgi:hypothetical protein
LPRQKGSELAQDGSLILRRKIPLGNDTGNALAPPRNDDFLASLDLIEHGREVSLCLSERQGTHDRLPLDDQLVISF